MMFISQRMRYLRKNVLSIWQCSDMPNGLELELLGSNQLWWLSESLGMWIIIIWIFEKKITVFNLNFLQRHANLDSILAAFKAICIRAYCGKKSGFCRTAFITRRRPPKSFWVYFWRLYFAGTHIISIFNFTKKNLN